MIEIALTERGKERIKSKNVELPSTAEFLSISFNKKYIKLLDKEKNTVLDLSDKMADNILFNDVISAEAEAFKTA